MTRARPRNPFRIAVAATFAALILHAAPTAAGVVADQPVGETTGEHDRFYARAVLRYLRDARPLIAATRDTARSCEAALRDKGRVALRTDEVCRISMGMMAEFERMREELAPHVSRIMGPELDHVMGDRERDLVLSVTLMVKQAQMAYQALARTVAGTEDRRLSVAEPEPGLTAGKETHIYR